MPLPFSGSRQTFPGAQRASLGGPAKDARARRGEPGAAGGGGRPRARAAGARGSRRGMGPAAAAGRAARPPAGPAALPAPSRLPLASAAARRAGARRAARNCFHCKQKKATHDQAGGGDARGGRGRREPERGKTWAGPPAAWGAERGPAGAAPARAPRGDRPAPRRSRGAAGPGRADSPFAVPRAGGGGRGPRDRGRRGCWVGGAPPGPFPGLRPRGGPALRRWQRVTGTLLPRPQALHGLKVKLKRITVARGLPGEGQGFLFYPIRRPGGTPRAVPQPSCSAHLVPQERHKGTAASRPGGRSSGRLQARVCQRKAGGHY